MDILASMEASGLSKIIITPDNPGVNEAQWVSDEMKTRGHEKLILVRDIKSAIALHNTEPFAIGGIRMQPYPDERSWIKEALGLAETMTDKGSMTRIDCGGGKCVINGNPTTEKSNPLVLRLAEEIETLSGKYIPSIDMGWSSENLKLMAEKTSHVIGLPGTDLVYINGNLHRGCENTSFVTARGGYYGIKACLEFINRGPLYDKVVGVQGLGKAGSRLAKMLFFAGARLVVCDTDLGAEWSFRAEINQEVTSDFRERMRFVRPNNFFTQDLDIIVLCAGTILDVKTISRLSNRCFMIASIANIPFKNAECDRLLKERGIYYVVDYALNMGGLYNVYMAIKDPRGYSEKRVLEDLRSAVPANLFEIHCRAEETGKPHGAVADKIAKERFRLRSILKKI